MKVKNIVVSGLLFFILTPAASYAQVSCGATGCTGPASELIEALFPSPDGGILIQSSLTVNAATCTGVNGNPTITLPDTHPNYKETYATLLTASVADKSVQLRMDDSEATCTLFFTRMFN